MQIKLVHDSLLITPRLTAAYNHRTKKGVDIHLEGKAGAYETVIDSLDVAADLLANRGWALVEPELLAVPVIRNDDGFMHPDEFVWSAKLGRLTRDQVKKLHEKKAEKKAKSEKNKEKEKGDDDLAPPPAGGLSDVTVPPGDAPLTGGPGTPGWTEDEDKV